MRSALTGPMGLQLDPNPDLLAALGERRRAAGDGPVLVDGSGTTPVPAGTKHVVAHRILDRVSALIRQRFPR